MDNCQAEQASTWQQEIMRHKHRKESAVTHVILTHTFCDGDVDICYLSNQTQRPHDLSHFRQLPEEDMILT